jgi:glycosyltransferase involved in cell wall biosynthesis
MKIVFVTLVDISSEGGAATHVREIVKNLQRNGNEIHLIASTGQRTSSDAEIANFHDMGYLPRKRNLVQPLFLILAFARALVSPRKYVRDADILYGRDTFMGPVLPLLRWLWNRNAKIVYEHNGFVEDEFHLEKTFLNRIYERWVRCFDDFTMTRVDAIIAVTREIKEVLVKRHESIGEKIHVVYNGVDTDRFCCSNDKSGVEKLRRELGIRPDDLVVGYVGRLLLWQGVDYLVQSAPLIIRQFPSVKFLIVGSGDMEKELARMAQASGVSHSFIFVGKVPHQEVPKFINACDLCVSLKRRKFKSGFSPIKLYEYLACERPVIASDAAGFDVLETYKCGFGIDPAEPEQVARAIITLLQNDSLRKEMGKNGRKFVVTANSWMSVAKRVSEVCEGILDHHPKLDMGKGRII